MSGKSEVTLSVSGLAELQAKFDASKKIVAGAFRSAQETVAPFVQSTARGYATKDTGQMRASIIIHPPTGEGLEVETAIGTNLKHAEYQNDGTGIYAGHGMIQPKTKPFLAWKGKDGQWHRAKAVRGVKALKFMEKAAAENRVLYRTTVALEVSKALKD